MLAQGGRFSPRLDVLTHLSPLYLLGGAIVVVAALFARRRLPPALLGAVAIAFSLALMGPELVAAVTAPPPAPADTPNQVKIIQFNAARDSQQLEARLTWLAQADPDVLVVQDALPTFQTQLKERLNRQMSCGMTCEVAIFTRGPPLAIESPRRGRIGLGPAIAVAHLPGLHGPYSVVGTHFVWPTDILTHQENSYRLMEVVRPMDHRWTILVGDFNSTPWSFARRRDDAQIGLVRRTRALATWPANGPFGLAMLPIDHVYAGAGWRTVSITRGPRTGSDHYPVVAVFAPR